MPRSTKHKSHRPNKHNSKDYSDSEEDVKMVKSSKDENLAVVSRDSAYGEKRKSSSQVREGREGKDIAEHGNVEASEDYYSTKRRKEKSGFGVRGDRWNAGDDERGNSNRVLENETIKGESSKVESKSKEFSSKGESLRNKSKKYETGSAVERKESSASVVVEEEDSKSKAESKRRLEKDNSTRKEGKEYKDKDRMQEKEKEKVKEKEKEKEKGQESNRVDEAGLVDIDVGKSPGLQQGDLNMERQLKRGQESSDFPGEDDSQTFELEKELDKRIHKRRENSSDRGKYHDACREDERGFTSRSDRVKNMKHRDGKHKDENYSDRYHEGDDKDDRQRDEKYYKETSKDNKHRDDKHRIDGEKDGRHREDRRREEDDGDHRTKDEKHLQDGERDTKRRYDKYQEGTDREIRNKDDRNHEDGDRNRKRRDDRYYEDDSKNSRHGDERYYEDGDKDRRRGNSYRQDGNRDIRRKEEKHCRDVERESQQNDSKEGSDFDREKCIREEKYRDEKDTKDRSADKPDPRHSIDDNADCHSKISSACNDGPTVDDSTRNRDDQGMRRLNAKGNYSDIRSRSTNDQRFDAEKSGSGAGTDSTSNRGWSTSRKADVELNSGNNRRRSSPSSSSLAPRDRYRLSKPDESKYRDYSHEERNRHNITSSRGYSGGIGGSEKTSISRPMEKHVQKEDGHFGELFADRRLKSDISSSPMQLLEKSSPNSTDRRHFRSDVRRIIDVDEPTQRSGGSRDVNDYSAKEGRGPHESAMDMFLGNEFSHADADTLSVSSPFSRNNHFSSSSKSFPPLKTGVDSPSMGSAEDDSRFKSNNRYRRSGDSNMGRVQGNAWRGVPSWPPPVVNGFIPFPHAPSVNFHSVMQPFPTPVFGIRPSVDLTHPTPYHMPNADRFSGLGRPIGWRNPVDGSCLPLHAWDTSNSVLRDESHMYGRLGWDHSRSLPDGRGWDTTGDLWKGPSRTVSLEMSSSEKDNSSVQNADEASAAQSSQPVQNEQNIPGQHAESAYANQFINEFENNVVEAPQIVLKDTSDDANMSKEDDVLLCHVYLSKLDMSANLTEPELLNQCSGFSDMGQSIISDVGDSKILFVEETVEAKVECHQILRYVLSSQMDDSVFLRAMSLYGRQKDSLDKVIAGEKFPIPEFHQEGLNPEINATEKQSSTHEIRSVEDALSNSNVDIIPVHTLLKVEGCTEALLEKPPILPVACTMVESEESISTLDVACMVVDLALNPFKEDHVVEEKPLRLPEEIIKGFDTSSSANVKNDDNIEELNLTDTECVTLVNSDMFSEVSEAVVPASLVSGSVNVSRIHHSPESSY